MLEFMSWQSRSMNRTYGAYEMNRSKASRELRDLDVIMGKAVDAMLDYGMDWPQMSIATGRPAVDLRWYFGRHIRRVIEAGQTELQPTANTSHQEDDK